MAWRIVALNVPAASQQLVAGECRVFGWAVHESSGGAVARLRLWDGGAASGTLFLPISLTADQSTRDWLGPHGVKMQVGLFYEAEAGAIEGSVWVGFHEDDSPADIAAMLAALGTTAA